jgi:hypothetical protein
MIKLSMYVLFVLVIASCQTHSNKVPTEELRMSVKQVEAQFNPEFAVGFGMRGSKAR